MRCDKSKPIHEQIMCHDDDGPSIDGGAEQNHKYFKLMGDNIPTKIGGKEVDYCVDPTS